MLKSIAHRSQPGIKGMLPLYALVGPVGGKAALRNIVHTLGAYLHLNGVALGIAHGDVQRLIAIGLRIGKPVAQALGVRLVFFRHIGIYLPAEVVLNALLRLAVYYETHSIHIIHALERHLLDEHLLVYAVGRLGPHLDFVMYAGPVELAFQRLDELAAEPLAVRGGGSQLVFDGTVLLRLGEFEIYVFELALDIVKSKLVGKRDIEHQSFELLLLP